MAQQTATESENKATTEPRTEGVQTPDTPIGRLIEKVKVYRNVGLDAEGSAHLFDPEEGAIIVCETDRRCRGLREGDVDEVYFLSGEKTVVEWAQYVQDRRGWDELRGDVQRRAFGEIVVDVQ